ncbi:MAG: hypothetical protein QF516_07040, partial [Pirellulaceae bacterium]|nr:hypothetical protein [Pirellulaceae bacterium]
DPVQREHKEEDPVQREHKEEDPVQRKHKVIRGQTSLSPVDIAIGGAFAPVRLDMYSLLGKTGKEK